MGLSPSNLLRNGSGRHHHHHHHHHHHPQHQRPHQDIHSTPYVFAAATPYPPPPPMHYQQYPGYYPGPPPGMHPLPQPYPHVLQHEKAVTIRNDVNVKKETLGIFPDPEHPGKFLVSFTFDATVSGSLSIVFFGEEGKFCSLTSAKDTLFEAVTVQFEKGVSQKFKQPSGTGIELSMFEEVELVKASDKEVYPLSVIAVASPEAGNKQTGSTNSQITQAVFEIKKGGYHVRVVNQVLLVNGTKYVLQEIYGIENSVNDNFDGNDHGKECVICLSEPRDTTVLPCRHMCMCSGCAIVLRFQTNRCPICRQPVEQLLEIKVNNNNNKGTGE